VFLLYDSIEGASQTIWNYVTHFAVTISFLLMVAFGLVGYATFGDLTQGKYGSFFCGIFTNNLLIMTFYNF
jgi:vacuolar-type H+-ATPase subunit I/STV1